MKDSISNTSLVSSRNKRVGPILAGIYKSRIATFPLRCRAKTDNPVRDRNIGILEAYIYSQA